ncbi:BatA domain-containing protein [Autumnicola musiva]|uniref:BatA domain-containing protein n=1 Tax=Autumnicola musiva TaxID=3075589 RepID=A0ABU3D756_9FLAO|nr:BatA domain-containing protein [Zunongwangia sp. F117]MDT0676833.1 BatA domain-containing protein [Zunongwangia sp. F117]
MYFKYPELLYALFLLILPIIVHLFQLRRFRKEEFTNVKFLKKISRQTRKSSRLKKWLILLIRMFALGSIIFAFAQPYFPASQNSLKSKSRLFYLDNSFSMQALAKNEELLPEAVQDLLENLPKEGQVNIITNDQNFIGNDAANITNILQNIEYTSTPMNFANLKLRAQDFFENNPAELSEFILISDFQENSEISGDMGKGFNLQFLPIQPENIINISIDSAYVSERNPENIELKVQLSSTGNTNGQTSVSISNGTNLLGKSAVNFAEKDSVEIGFSISNENIGDGRVTIEDNGLQYDNSLYFNMSTTPPIKTVLLSDPQNSFLKRIYTEPEFELSNFPVSEIDYSSLAQARLIVIEEPEEIPPPLSDILEKKVKEGSVVVFIPALDGNTASYNSFLGKIGAPRYGSFNEQNRLITGIQFAHPLFNSVFEEEVLNFQYPSVNSYFNLSNGSGNTALSYQNNAPFLAQNGRLFLFTAALNNDNSNFRNSPLVVPAFYNMGLMALKPLKLYYQINESNQIDIPVSSAKDEVLTIASEEENFIPQQQAFSDRVQLTTDELPEIAGNYEIQYRDEVVGHLSYNYDRNESELEYVNLLSLENVEISNNISEYFETEIALSKITSLWKWFIIFALFFLILEMLLLKFLK